MWKELQNSPAFFLLFDRGSRYHIIITDYIRIWDVYYTEDEFIALLRKSNFGLEIDKRELLDKGIQMLQNPSKLKNIKITIEGQKLAITMTMLFGFPLKLLVDLNEGSKELFFQKVTLPALKTIHDLRCSQQELRKMLITKDDEIEEYKSFGGKIRYTAIPPYNDDAHMRKHCMFNVNYDTELPLSVLERIVEVPQENLKIKQEMIETKMSIKLEPASQGNSATGVANTSNTVKMEDIKNEYPAARRRKLNL